MGSETTVVIRGGTRIFTIQWRAGPRNAPKYQGRMMAGAPSQAFGDPRRIEQPDPARYNGFIPIAQIPGTVANAAMTLTGRYGVDLSDLLRLARLGCALDVQVHMGQCEDPRDFNAGWSKILVLENALLSSWGTDGDLGALSSDNQEVVNEAADISAAEQYEIIPLAFSERAGTVLQNEVIAIVPCDAPSCGDCDDPSEGCEKVFAIQLSAGGSPGILPEVAYTSDGGSSWAGTLIDTLAANEEPDGAACVGPNLIVISQDSCSLHWAPRADILGGVEVWTEVTTGFVALNCPLAIFALSPREVWIVGENGYVYFAEDPTASVSVQDAGVATVEDLNTVHAFDSEHIVAAGANNAVIHTENGGDTWQAVTGPAAGVVLNTVFMKTAGEWWVGTASGRLYYTTDEGQDWTEKSFPGSGAGTVYDIKFATDTVGFLSHSTAAPAGRILRTIDGGFSWYVLPEDAGAIPANDRITSLGICVSQPNVVFGGGLADSAADGIIVKAA